VVFLSIGTDIEKVSKFREKEFTKNEKFYEKIFTKNEITYCLEKIDPYPHFTARFCAKEATIKAIENNELTLEEIEIKSNNGIPSLKLPKPFSGLISMSHTKEYAIAFVVIDKS